tara:strand:+ start:272 stop:607 length:336 start_codon:yes stop_codon:yes gene_type:complete
MPAINLKTSVAFNEETDLLKELSRSLSVMTGKPESYVMTSIESDVMMTFGGSTEPCCYVEVKSIGALKPSEMSRDICKLISSKLQIPENRIYIEFADVQAKFWGWDGRTFG